MDARARHVQNQARYIRKLLDDPNAYLDSATHGCELCAHLAECRQLVRTMAPLICFVHDNLSQQQLEKLARTPTLMESQIQEARSNNHERR